MYHHRYHHQCYLHLYWAGDWDYCHHRYRRRQAGDSGRRCHHRAGDWYYRHRHLSDFGCCHRCHRCDWNCCRRDFGRRHQDWKVSPPSKKFILLKNMPQTRKKLEHALKMAPEAKTIVAYQLKSTTNVNIFWDISIF